MAFINIYIENPCTVKVKNNKLVLINDGKTAEYPINDINCLLIDCLYNAISVYSLQKLCENGATVILSDEKHIPSSILLPFNKYYKRLSVINSQINISKPRQKALWQNVIKQKILNQAECLKINGKENADYLVKLSEKVLSGDSENTEATAAAVYFKSLFNPSFSREQDNVINASLNYCYAIVRSLICRHLSAKGFECSIGIFHKSQLNNFNLADDVIEPFRPIVDNFVSNTLTPSDTTLNPLLKKSLFKIVNLNVYYNGQVHSLSNAVEKTIDSLSSYYIGTSQNVVMPKIYNNTMHEFE